LARVSAASCARIIWKVSVTKSITFVNMPTSLSFTISVLAFVVTAPLASASEFLRVRTHGELQEATLELLKRTLLSELAIDTARLRQFEEELRPMYVALPKNEHGFLEPTTVRYALHRFFVQKHGWYVKGLEPAGQAWNSSAPNSIMRSRVPEYIQSLFEERLHGQGMSLHELAVFGATVSDFVHNDVVADVVDLYAVFGLSTTEPARNIDVDRVTKAYVLQLLDEKTIKSTGEMRDAEAAMTQDFPAWSDLKMWVHDARQTMSLQRSRRSLSDAEFTLDTVVEEVQELNDRLGAFQNLDCRSIKAGLMDIEHKGSGRVLLSDFYHEGLQGGHLFIEHADYLRRLGALDESDVLHPSVIIANYLAGQANCLTSTNFHSVCCFDECQGLMGHLERAIAAPVATAGRIAELVAGLQSDTVDAPRNLSASLLSRLGEIADHHDGLVPLHGRLFAQWLHHAYPLECPYPHVAGTTSPLTPSEWMDETGEDELALSEQDRQLIVTKYKKQAPRATAQDLPWSFEEELVFTHKFPAMAPGRASMARKVAALAALIAFVLPLAKVSSAAAGSKAKWQHVV